VPSAHDASVHIDSVPFLGRLAVSGHVSEVRATATDVTAGRVRFSRIAVELHHVHVDRDRLVLHRQVDLQEIGRGMAAADISQADLRSALGNLPIVLGNGRISITLAGVTASVTVTLRDNVLRLSAGPLKVPAITIPKLPLLPCVANAVSQPGRLHLSCAVDKVPDELLREVKGEGSS
jgi:hypothetical protein